METLNIDGIEISVKRKKIKNLYIRMNSSSGKFEANVSYSMPFADVENFLRSKVKWLKKHKNLIERRTADISQNNYADGENILLFGGKRVLRVFDCEGAPKIFSDCGAIELHVNSLASKEYRKKVLDAFYKTELEKVVPAFINKWLLQLNIKIASSVFDKAEHSCGGGKFRKLVCPSSDIEKVEVSIAREPIVIYKRMKSRWGICSISEGKITLNTELAKKTLRCVEYVIAHELLHLKERKHNKSFKDCMKKLFPDWKTLEEELKIL
ncbi:MAG: M48 family metallopeptidase [Endomicrobium sp.]|jgi:predicted metal-dependent hydrolase|nr:M48 family metallopeptidase [Endomicrobium sp.]